jgi:hypothetical protein
MVMEYDDYICCSSIDSFTNYPTSWEAANCHAAGESHLTFYGTCCSIIVFTRTLRLPWFCDFRLQFLKPIVFTSSHLVALLVTLWGPSGLYKVKWQQHLYSCIKKKKCASHLKRPTVITFTICGSLYSWYSWLYLDLHISYEVAD